MDTTVAQRRLVRGLLSEAPNTFRTRLLSLYADLSGFAGWLSFDLSNYAAAADYYEAARAAAHEAADTALGALILCNMSQLATWRGQHRTGIDHAVAAQVWADQTDDVSLQAYVRDVAARGFAVEGNERAAMDAIAQARSRLDRVDDDQKTLAHFFGHGQLASAESDCHLRLGRPEKAAEIAAFALTAIDQSFVRNRALASLRLGMCRLRFARPEVAGAAQAISDAARLASHNRSARLAQRLQHSWKQLKPWRGLPEVGNLREQLLASGVAVLEA